MAHEDRHPTDLQQRQAKMPAAGATQALRIAAERYHALIDQQKRNVFI